MIVLCKANFSSTPGLNSEHVMSSFTRPALALVTVDGGDTEPSRINTIGLGDKMIITPAGARE